MPGSRRFQRGLARTPQEILRSNSNRRTRCRGCSFWRILRAAAGPQHDALITDLLERIMPLEVNATGTRSSKRADGNPNDNLSSVKAQ